MANRYAWVIISYIIMQFSGYAGIPLLIWLGVPRHQIVGIWSLISFLIELIIILILIRPAWKKNELRGKEPAEPLMVVIWAIVGIVLAYISQIIAGMLEMYVFDIKPGSENTKRLVEVAKLSPYFLLVTCIIGPIIEEIIFRKIIFGSLYKRMNFFLSAVISALVFAAAHFDFVHILIYTAMGLTFSFLYVISGRIIVPIIAHVAMNSIVMLINVVFADKIQDLQQKAEKLHSIIGGLF
ncbi:CAAX amino protease [Fictibacillus macauensis ZFHKF-1]|uniref:CAAX amino protease n=1 Tax=Fictibacillus macauensis ZFHKF-1 TaxID=1196324 RepID=I8AG77_9BACL|nr:CPBP family intramembrane glutamic endopeptidase [Fictibacillus macauensis]EIT84409.1 CAAX amino protease [Fictibacillus macauensis ZFHKF-1]